VNEKKGVYTYYERESVRKMGEDIQRLAQSYSKPHRRNAQLARLFLSLFQLGHAVERFSALNGEMQIWASFTPDMFDVEEDIEGMEH
jgi:hypothetical protein